MKPCNRVIDVRTTASADEPERLLNAPYEDGYYSEKIVLTGLPDGIGARGFFKLRVKLERH